MIRTNSDPAAPAAGERPARWLVMSAAHLAASMLIALADTVFGAVAPGALSSVHGLRRTAMATYLAGCSMLVLGAVQVTPGGIGLAAVFLPVAVATIVLAIGCHLRLRRLGSELVGPEA